MSFDWQTQESTDWDIPPQSPPEPEEPSPARSRRHVLAGLLAIVLILVGLAAYRLLGQRVDAATKNVESDLLASYTVVEKAALMADPELFATFLSGKNKEWALIQEQLVREGTYQDRARFGLTWQAVEDPATAVISTTINSQLNSAGIVSGREYSYNIGNGLTETVGLQQTVVYRLGQDRWLFAPPEAEFWGEILQKKGYYLSLTYPERDEAIAERLLLEMDTAVASICASGSLDCPEGFQVRVQLLTDPAPLSSQFPSSAFIERQLVVRLPAPTLVGLPVSEAGYQVLARGYNAQLLNSVIRLLVGEPQQENQPFLQGWIDWQLARMGLHLPVQMENEWAGLLEQEVTLTSGEQPWRSSEADPVFIMALVDFLIDDLDVSPRLIVHSLSDGKIRLYAEWLQEMVDGRYTPSELEQRWQQYLLKEPARRNSLFKAD